MLTAGTNDAGVNASPWERSLMTMIRFGPGLSAEDPQITPQGC